MKSKQCLGLIFKFCAGLTGLKYFFDEYVGLRFEMNLIFEYKKGQPSNLTLRTTTDVLFTTSYKILQLTFKNFENVYTYLLTSINEDIVFLVGHTDFNCNF